MTLPRNGQDLAGRVAIVTGASSGIGEATAVALARRGARVLATGRNRQRLEVVARKNAEITPCVADLAERTSTDVVFSAAQHLGVPTILVCSAGLPGYIDQPIAAQSYEAWRQTMQVNLDSPFLMSKAIAPLIEAEGWGRIVYVSSTAGEVGAPSMAPYCASKHGLIGLMRSVAWDIGAYNATANAVCPGWVRTDMAERNAEQDAKRRGLSVEEIWRERAMSYPRKRVLTAEEVAQTISFLVSDAAQGINGEAITVALGGQW
jgi:NAD(P)-dependent dehydrogenase (short-subunit alcohol dehydrogenase family)